MALELRHLRNFVVVAEELHFGRAARRLSMSQPPLSVSIQQLEEVVGARLLDRDSKGVRLTSAGEAFRTDAQMLLAKAEEACVLAREIGSGAIGRLRIGFVGSLLFGGLPQWLRTFQSRHARIDAVLIELNSNDQIDALVRGELDVGFVHARHVPDTLKIVPFLTEPFLCCLPAGHPLARRRKLSLAMLRDERFVLFSRRVSPEYYSRIVEMCGSAGFYPRVRHELRHWLSVVALVSQGTAVSIVEPAQTRPQVDHRIERPRRGEGKAGVAARVDGVERAAAGQRIAAVVLAVVFLHGCPEILDEVAVDAVPGAQPLSPRGVGIEGDAHVGAHRSHRHHVVLGRRPVGGAAGVAQPTAVTWYQVVARDAAGNQSVRTAPLALTVLNGPDTQAPTAPKGLTVANGAPAEVLLSWNASADNLGVVSYAVLRNGVELSSFTTTSASITGVAPGTWWFQVVARDAAGNTSVRTAPVQVVVTDRSAPTAPTLVSVALDTIGNTVVTWTASTDDVGVVAYVVLQDGVEVQRLPITTFTSLVSTSHALEIRAVDAAGNLSEPLLYQLTP